MKLSRRRSVYVNEFSFCMFLVIYSLVLICSPYFHSLFSFKVRLIFFQTRVLIVSHFGRPNGEASRPARRPRCRTRPPDTYRYHSSSSPYHYHHYDYYHYCTILTFVALIVILLSLLLVRLVLLISLVLSLLSSSLLLLSL